MELAASQEEPTSVSLWTPPPPSTIPTHEHRIIADHNSNNTAMAKEGAPTSTAMRYQKRRRHSFRRLNQSRQ